MGKIELYNIISNLHHLRYTGGVDDLSIAEAEKTLQLKFATEYIEYLKEFGQIEAQGIELTGLSDKCSTSVINATNSLRKVASIPEDLYVIEDLGIDGIEYLQDVQGKIYQYSGRSQISMYADSLVEYINKSQNNNKDV